MKKARILRFLRNKRMKKLANLPRQQLRFAFDKILMSKTMDNELVATLYLTYPIERVVGSQFIMVDNTKIYTIATDVTEIKVHESVFNVDQGFDWNEDRSIGSYEGDSILDVAKRNCDVWLVDIPFIERAREFRQKFNKDRFDKVMKKFKQ